MPTNASRDHYAALLVPDSRVELWWDECQNMELSAGAHAGQPVEADGQRSDLTLRTLRRERAGAEVAIRVTTVEAGIPALTGADASHAAAFVWSPSPYSFTYGWSPPHVLSGWRSLKSTDGSGTDKRARSPHVCVTVAGTALASLEVERASSRRINIRRLPKGGSDWESYAGVIAGLDSSLPSTPCLLALPSGRAIIYYWDAFAVGSVRNICIAAYYSDDDGVTGARLSESVIREPLGVDSPSTPRYVAQSLRVAASPSGHVMLLANMTCSTNSACKSVTLQYASVDGGVSFQLVHTPADDEAEGSAHADVVHDGDAFVVAYLHPADGKPRVARVGSAFQSFLTGDIVTAGAVDAWNQASFSASKTISAAGLSLVRDETGALYLHAVANVSFPVGLTLASFDRGRSWERTDAPGGGNESWWSSLLTATRPESFATAAHEGRVLMVCTHRANGSGTEGDDHAQSVAVLYLGGYDTVTPPRIGYSGWEHRRAGWESTYISQFDEADDMGHTRSGTPTTEEIDSTGGLHLAHTGGSVTVSYTRSLFDRDGAFGVFSAVTGDTRAAVATSAQTVFYTAIICTGTKTFGMRVTMSATNIYVHEVTGVGTYTQRLSGSITPTYNAEGNLVPVQVKWVITPTGDLQVWRRMARDTAVNPWLPFASVTGLTDVFASITAGSIVFGANLDDGFEAWFYESHYNYGTDGRAQNLFAQSTTELSGRPFSIAGTYIDEGAVIAAAGGPTLRGESWDIATACDFAAERLLTPNPRTGWRAADTTREYRAAFRWAQDGDEPGLLDVLGIALVNKNVGYIEIELYDADAGAWGSPVGVDLTVGDLRWERSGAVVSPRSTGSYDGTATPMVREGEFDGAAVAVGSDVRAIVRTIGGKWQNDTARARLVLDGEQLDGTEGIAGSSGRIITTDAVVLLSLRGTPYTGVRVRVPSESDPDQYETTPDEPWFRAGTIVVGSVYVHADESDWGRVLETLSRTEAVTYPDGSVARRVLGPSSRRIEVAWVDGIDTTRAAGDDDSPAYHALDASGSPTALTGTTPWTVEGLFRRLAETGAAVVYLPRVPAFSGDATPIILNRRHQLVYGFVESESVRIETAQGEEDVDEVLRLATLTITELR